MRKSFFLLLLFVSCRNKSFFAESDNYLASLDLDLCKQRQRFDAVNRALQRLVLQLGDAFRNTPEQVVLDDLVSVLLVLLRRRGNFLSESLDGGTEFVGQRARNGREPRPQLCDGSENADGDGRRSIFWRRKRHRKRIDSETQPRESASELKLLGFGEGGDEDVVRCDVAAAEGRI